LSFVHHSPRGRGNPAVVVRASLALLNHAAGATRPLSFVHHSRVRQVAASASRRSITPLK